MEYKYKVAIIPGHGGYDPGAIAYDSYGSEIRECDGNLAVALKLGRLCEYNNMEPLYSRTDDTACGNAKTSSQDVTNQITFVNNCGADVAIAIHFNASDNESANGVEVLYNSEMYYSDGREWLAKLLLDELVETTGLTNRGLKTPSNISIVKKSKIPCVLSENAFITNPAEQKWCYDDKLQDELAKAHCRALCKFLNIGFKEIKDGSGDVLDQFIDAGDISVWAKEAMRYFVENGILQGDGTGKIMPKEPMTKEQQAVFLYNTIKKLGLV